MRTEDLIQVVGAGRVGLLSPAKGGVNIRLSEIRSNLPLKEGRCTFCDGTEGGNPPEEKYNDQTNQ